MKEKVGRQPFHSGESGQNPNSRGIEGANGSGASCPEPTCGMLRVLTDSERGTSPLLST